MQQGFLRYPLIIAIIFLLNSPSGFGQESKQENLFTIDRVPTSTQEFLYVYKKNNSSNDEAYSKSDIDTYLELFINFKLKVTEARALGYDTTLEYKGELDKYKEQLTKPYLTEKEVTERLIEEAYQRLKTEVDVSHILVLCGPDALPDDTLRAHQKIQDIWDKAAKGADFSNLALEYSEEPAIQQTRGHLGYFTALQMVYPFENAAYSTPVNNISQPFRTQFGYHVLNVHDKRPSKGKVSISHILLRFKPSMTKDDSVQLRNKIFEIYDLAASGVDWDMLCNEHSEDFNSKKRGGSLSPFGVGEMIPSIAEASFSLKEKGEISDPVMSPYGWHILKLNGYTPIPSFEDYKTQLSRRIQRDSRSNKSKEVLIKRLKQENGFLENSARKEAVFNLADSTSFSGSWDPELKNDMDWDQQLFSLTDSVYNIRDFIDYVNANFRKAGTGPDKIRLMKLYDSFIEDSLIEYEKVHLEDKYEDFRYLMKEYREGILLFEIMENEVWQKSGLDSLGLIEFYNNNLGNYKVKERASLITFAVAENESPDVFINRLSIISKDTTITLDSVKELVKKEFPEIMFKSMGTFVKGTDEWEDWMSQGIGIHNGKNNDRTEVTLILEYRPEYIQDLDQIKGLVISDYQEYLDHKWIETLREKYEVKVNKSAVKKLYKTLVQ